MFPLYVVELHLTITLMFPLYVVELRLTKTLMFPLYVVELHLTETLMFPLYVVELCLTGTLKCPLCVVELIIILFYVFTIYGCYGLRMCNIGHSVVANIRKKTTTKQMQDVTLITKGGHP